MKKEMVISWKTTSCVCVCMGSIFHLMEFCLHFVYIFITDLSFFLTKFGSSDLSLNRNILALSIWNLKHLSMSKFQLFINIYYLQVCWHDMSLKLTLWYLLINEVSQWFFNLITWLFQKIYSDLFILYGLFTKFMLKYQFYSLCKVWRNY